MATSITHRASGILLAVGSCALVFWLITAALGPDAYAVASGFFRSGAGIALLMLWSWSFFFHLCNGIRHLFWDWDIGLALPAAFASGLAAVFVSAALTIVTWIFGFIVMGGAA